MVLFMVQSMSSCAEEEQGIDRSAGYVSGSVTGQLAMPTPRLAPLMEYDVAYYVKGPTGPAAGYLLRWAHDKHSCRL